MLKGKIRHSSSLKTTNTLIQHTLIIPQYYQKFEGYHLLVNNGLIIVDLVLIATTQYIRLQVASAKYLRGDKLGYQ